MVAPHPKSTAQEEEVSLKGVLFTIRNIIRFLLKKKKVIFIAIMMGMLVGLAYSFWEKPSYTATLSFVLDEEKTGGALSAYAGIASQFGISLGGADDQGLFSNDNIIEFIKSRSMIQKTLLSQATFGGKQELLVNRYVQFRNLREKWAKKPRIAQLVFHPDTTGVYLQDSLLGIMCKDLLKKNISVEKLDKKLTIISLSVETTDELFSKAFAEQLMQNVRGHYTQIRTQKSADNLAVLNHMVDSVRRELDAAIGGVASAVEANPNANMAFQSLKVPSQKRSVDVQANTAIFSELVKQRELARISLQNDQPLIQVLDKPILPLEKSKVGKIKALLLGGILFGVLTGLFLLGRVFLKRLMHEEQ